MCFCEKTKYLKGTKTREALIQCVDLQADNTVRRATVSKSDGRVLTIVTRELFAAEACYYKSCYRDYTRNVQGGVSNRVKREDEESLEYNNAESQAPIQTDLLQNPRVVRIAELYTLFTSFLKSQGVAKNKRIYENPFQKKT